MTSRLRKPASLRCYTRPTLQGTVAAECVTLNLLVIGDTVEQARAKLDDAIGAHLSIAFEEEDCSDLFPRHAGVSSYCWYALAWCFHGARDAGTAFNLFKLSPPEMQSAAC